MKKLTILPIIVLFAFSSCEIEDNYPPEVILESNFEYGLDEWTSFFSEYPVSNEAYYELAFAQKQLPAPLDVNKAALKISGNNRNKNLMLCIYREVEDLKPNTDYLVTFDVDVASNASTINSNLGNPSLMLGVGGLDYLPENTEMEGIYYPNFPSLLQTGQSNEIFLALGRIGVNSISDEYKLISMNNLDNPIEIRTDRDGKMWLLVCLDSDYQEITTVYYDNIDIKLLKQ